MSLRSRSEHAVDAIASALKTQFEGDQKIEIVEIVEQAIIHAVLEERERCVSVASDCCPEDRDRAHKIEESIRRAEGALVANLQGLR